jgi:hypothetical protein
MGLGPKWEGGFTPPAPPPLPAEADPAFLDYTREMERYILQLHDQLNVTFEKAQNIVNQIIYQGDGDGDFTVSNETEEGEVVIESTTQIWGPNFRDDYAWILFPLSTTMHVGWNEAAFHCQSTANAVWTWPLWIPFDFKVTDITLKGHQSTGGTLYCGAGIYEWNSPYTVITSGTAAIPVAATAIHTLAGTTDYVFTAGLYRIAYSISSTSLLMDAHRLYNSRSGYDLVHTAMQEHAFGISDQVSASGVMPGTLGTISVNGHAQRAYVPLIMLEGVPV